MAKPASAKLLIKSIAEAISFLLEEKNKNLKILVLVNSVGDAQQLSNQITEIKSINFGGIRGKDGSRLISKAIAVTDADVVIIRELLAKEIELEIRQVPTDKKQAVETLI